MAKSDSTYELVSLDDESKDCNDNGVVSYDFTSRQQALVDTNQIRINQRTREIKEIAQQVVELAEMFDNVAMLVGAQGEMLDCIDYNIEIAERALIDVNVNLKIVAKSEKKSFSKWLCLLFVILLLFGAAIMIAIILAK